MLGLSRILYKASRTGRTKHSTRLWRVGVAIMGVLLTAGCSEVVEWFDSPSYPPQQSDYASDFDYCDQLARATLHAEGEISSDIGHELETDHTTQGPDTLERNMGSYEERKRFEKIVAECLRHRRSSRPVGANR
jgi:hypothetical protein